MAELSAPGSVHQIANFRHYQLGQRELYIAHTGARSSYLTLASFGAVVRVA